MCNLHKHPGGDSHIKVMGEGGLSDFLKATHINSRVHSFGMILIQDHLDYGASKGPMNPCGSFDAPNDLGSPILIQKIQKECILKVVLSSSCKINNDC